MQPFADNLSHLFALRKLDHHVLAPRLGCTPSEILAWMQGKGQPDLQQLVILSALLQVSVDRLLKVELRLRTVVADIRLLILDVDAVLTDGGIYLTEKGDEFKKFHSRDGRGIMTAIKRGIEVGFISGGVQSNVIKGRAERLGVKRWYSGNTPKTIILEEWMAATQNHYAQVAYIGDDANDLGVIAKAGLTACPADASTKVKESVDIILKLPGGQGCVREFIEEHLGIVVD
jgi:3-deoxy-D-manno-octulosonate 8-phosphate phosphatase (KDO 8-P phosphatase)